MKIIRFYIILFLLLPTCLEAQNFSDFFIEKTLRIDYLFSGDANKQSVYLDELSSLPIWAGRRHHLSELPLKGNGQVYVTDSISGKTIYTTSFSSLFLEWLSTDEAKHVAKGFEHTILIPYPKRSILIETRLCDSYGKTIAKISHYINPKDILIHAKGLTHITPHKSILYSGDPKNCIDIVILAEGYTNKEMAQFYKDATIASKSLFQYEPFKSSKNHFNIVAVASPSIDSGISIPRENKWKKTAFMSHFDTFYSDRYLTTTHIKLINDALAGIPYEHIIILANTNTYGGGGIYNDFTLTTAHHSMFKPVVVHEFGHSFGGLADEYYYEGDTMDDTYPLSVEPWEQNITTNVNFASKWQDLIKKGTPLPTPINSRQSYPIGLYEGAGYSGKGIYRACFDCRMRSNQASCFCPICQRALKKIIDFYTLP
jgi:hypothetical protein